MDTTRRSLLSAIKDPGNSRAWDEFYGLYSGFVRALASDRGLGLRGHEVDDVVGRVFLGLAQGTPRYDPSKGRFRSLLGTTVRRRASDLRRERRPLEAVRVHRPAGDTRKTGTLERIEDVRPRHDLAAADREWESAVLRLALAEVKKRVRPKQYQIFDAYVLREWPVKQVKATVGVTANQVYLAKKRVGDILRQEACAAERRLDRPSLPGTVKVDGKSGVS